MPVRSRWPAGGFCGLLGVMAIVVRVAALVLALAIAGCAGPARLVPAPEAEPAGPGIGVGGVARAAGVTVTARVGAWTGFPSTLPRVATPVLVSLDNMGPEPLRVRHEDFTLVTPEGLRLVGQGPYAVRGVVATSAPVAYHPRVAIGVGWGWPWWYDPFWDPYFYPPVVHVALPTPDMISLALPESVVAPGARLTGFVYFAREWRKALRADLVVRLTNNRTGAELGTVTIPFLVEN